MKKLLRIPTDPAGMSKQASNRVISHWTGHTVFLFDLLLHCPGQGDPMKRGSDEKGPLPRTSSMRQVFGHLALCSLACCYQRQGFQRSCLSDKRGKLACNWHHVTTAVLIGRFRSIPGRYPKSKLFHLGCRICGIRLVQHVMPESSPC